MRNIFTTLTTVALLLAGTSAAFAGGTSTYNKYTTVNTHGGYTETTVDAEVVSESLTTTESTSLKVESIADLGDVNVANVSVSGSIDGNVNFKATSHSSNNRPVDPVATVYVTEVTSFDTTSVSETADISTFSSNKFSGTEFTHEVGNNW